MKKVTLQEIADEIGVSRITISKVINNRPGVSERTRKRIVNALIEHNYKNISHYADTAQNQPVSESKQTIGVVSIAPDFSAFWLQIIQAISGELNYYSQDVVFFFIARNQSGKYELPTGVDSSRLTGLVVINVYDDQLIDDIKNTNIPAVFFDLPAGCMNKQLPGDVVFLEGRQASRTMTGALLDAGFQKLAFIGDTEYAQTIDDRWLGFMDAHEERGVRTDSRFLFTKSQEFYFYSQPEMDSLVSGLKTLPDAFVCANDDIAKRLVLALRAQGRLDETKVLITGYDNMKDPVLDGYLYATASVDTKALGLRLVRQILTRIQNPDDALEMVYLFPAVEFFPEVLTKKQRLKEAAAV